MGETMKNGTTEQAAFREGFAAGRMEARVDALEKAVNALIGKIDELVPAVADLRARAAIWGGITAAVVAPLAAWLIGKL